MWRGEKTRFTQAVCVMLSLGASYVMMMVSPLPVVVQDNTADDCAWLQLLCCTRILCTCLQAD